VIVKVKNKTIKSLDWLLEPEDVGIRYLALRDIVKAGPKELSAAGRKAHKEGPIALVLDKMNSEGYWIKPGPGYTTRYRGNVWSLILLSQLGASIEFDGRIKTACDYYLNNAMSESGQIGYNGQASGTIDCLQGNMCAALLNLGYADKRLDKAFEWMARSVTGEGIAPSGDNQNALHYFSYKCGPVFACGANNKKSCAWGAVKVMLAFSKLSADRRTPVIERAIKAGSEFIFSRDPAKADYPTRHDAKPSREWWKFGFPVFYVTDVLQNVEAMAGLGFAGDPRLADSLKLIREKQDDQGRWALDHDYCGKTWLDFGVPKQSNKWVTCRAWKVLEVAGDNKEV
jgi:hypothetical protein